MRILFIGTGDIGVPALASLLGAREHEVLGVVTQPDKPAGRKQELLASPIKQLALRHGVSVFQPARIRNEEAVAQIRSLHPEVIVVMAYGQILPREILEIPSVAILNLHASLLPRHRGAAPIQAAIESGDRESGITAMYVDEGLDTGDILLKKSIPIRRRETGGSLHDRLAQIAPTALADALALLQNGTAPRIPQDSSLTRGWPHRLE
jgi:methionyl-tRNA formyltransferase